MRRRKSLSSRAYRRDDARATKLPTTLISYCVKLPNAIEPLSIASPSSSKRGGRSGGPPPRRWQQANGAPVCDLVRQHQRLSVGTAGGGTSPMVPKLSKSWKLRQADGYRALRRPRDPDRRPCRPGRPRLQPRRCLRAEDKWEDRGDFGRRDHHFGRRRLLRPRGADAENEEADRYPLGPKEFWRARLVGNALYGSDQHPMTDGEFEADWAESERQ